MTTLESKYYDYMDFDTEQESKLSSIYLDFFSETDSILELAPGRGDFMYLLQSQGKKVVGVDIDKGMVEQARQRGLDVTLSDASTFLRKAQADFDGIFCAHFVEHLTSPQLIELLSLCRRVLAKNGILVIVAPNPASLQIQLNEFWRDPTHVRPYNLELLHFLLADCGYEVIASGGNPYRLYHPLGSPEFRLKERLPVIVPKSSNQQIHANSPQISNFPRKPRRFFVSLLKRIGLGPLINLYDRVWLLERAVNDMYQSNEIYIVGKNLG